MYDYYEPKEERFYRTCCQKCDWCDDETYKSQADCTVSVCPECGSDDVEDEVVYE